jgi:hypothetical protein
MERSDGCRDAGEVPRLLVFWSRPHHISRGEADAWLHSEVGRLLGLEAVERAYISRLERASDRHGLPWDGMLELHLAPGASVAACVDSPDWRDWFGDLRLLGMRPSAIVADGTVELERRVA